ncbi:cupin-like domain-containing protein [Paraburkholderia sp. D1E]|uniref:cupin-like domain-containing protein n=1 Tax=Paraburkholderia sp. D1E TaxID=3461398 RepID=UPI004045C65F
MNKRDSMIARVTRSEFSASFFEQDTPAIITDALNDWPIADRWTPAYLAGVSKTQRVTLSTSSDGRYQFDSSDDGAKSHAFDTAEIDFGTATARMLEEDAGDHIYVMQQSIPDVLPELLDNLVVPEWIVAQRPAINLWFGRRTTTQLHFDYSNNFFAQLYGSKQFTLFAPDESARLYPYHHGTATAHISYVDLNAPDLARYPEFANAAPLSFTIHSGELLFMPAFWWHHVQAAEVAVSVNFWWFPQLRQILASPNAVRALPNFYGIDRLLSFKQGFLQPAQLDFVTAGELFLEHGRIWAAGVLALAAFDEWARGAEGLRHVDRPQGCRLRDLATDLRRVCAALQGIGHALADRHMQAIDSVPALAAQLAEFLDDALIDRGGVVALLRMMRSAK